MFSVGSAAPILLAAWPPAPMVAKFSFSLGDLYPMNLRLTVLPNPPIGIAPVSKDP